MPDNDLITFAREAVEEVDAGFRWLSPKPHCHGLLASIRTAAAPLRAALAAVEAGQDDLDTLEAAYGTFRAFVGAELERLAQRRRLGLTASRTRH